MTVEELAEALFQLDASAEEVDRLGMRSIDAAEAVGPEDEGSAALIDKVGWRRYWVGRYQDAEGLLLRSLSLRLRLLGPGDQRTAESAIQLAIMYDYRGFDVDPGPYYRQALEGYEASLGINHPETFKARYRLADYLIAVAGARLKPCSTTSLPEFCRPIRRSPKPRRPG